MSARITIITPSYEQGLYLDACLRSVQDQTYPGLEHIVVDGGSTDGSKEIIERYAHGLAWWCSEADRGQSHAINKGLARSTGDVLGWVNSDDELLPGALHTVGAAFESDPELVMFCGCRILLYTDGSRTRSPLNSEENDALFVAPVINQQSTFFRASCVKAVGGVDEALRYCMDLDLWWRLLFAFGSEHLRTVDVELALFRVHAGSKTTRHADSFVHETAALLRAMAVSTGQGDLVELLDIGYDERADLRPSNAGPEHAALVRKMIVRFVVKWNGVVSNERQFRMLVRLNELHGNASGMLEPTLEQRWARLRKGMVAPGYLLYRIGRKFKLWPA